MIIRFVNDLHVSPYVSAVIYLWNNCIVNTELCSEVLTFWRIPFAFTVLKIQKKHDFYWIFKLKADLFRFPRSNSHLQEAEGGREGRSDVLLHDPQRDGVRHQKRAFPGARRVRRKPVRHQDQLHPRGHRDGKDLHPGCQPTGRRSFIFTEDTFSK